MTGETDRALVRATKAIAENFGIRYCTQCGMTKSVEGGRTKRVSNNRTRWECAGCVAKLTGAIYASKSKGENHD